MKKQLLYLATAILLALGFTSCEADVETISAFTNYDKGKLNQTIPADGTSIEGGFKFTTTEAWSVIVGDKTKTEVDKSWITVSPMSGDAGANEIKIQLDMNYTGEDRIEKINIKSGEYTITVTIKQEATTEENEKPTTPKIITSYTRSTQVGEVVVDDMSSTTTLKYDSDWRLLSYQDHYKDKEHNTDNIEDYLDIDTFKYTNNGFTWDYREGGEIYDGSLVTNCSYTLNDKGFISQIDEHYSESNLNEVGTIDLYQDDIKYIPTYNNEEYLIKVNETKVVKQPNQDPYTSIFESIITWTKGNITKIVETNITKYPEIYEIQKEQVKFRTRGYNNATFTINISYTDYEDKTNVNLLFEDEYSDLGVLSNFASYVRKFGKSNRNLMSEYNYNDGYTKYKYKFTYTMDKDGYPTKIVETITRRWVDSSGDMSSTSIHTYDITYNK